MCSYVRYVLHLEAYLHLVGNPYPGFVGEEGEYPIDLRLPPPGPQSRGQDAVPDLHRAAGDPRLRGARGRRKSHRLAQQGQREGKQHRHRRARDGDRRARLVRSLVRGQMPKGLRDAGAYSLGYGAQMLAFLLFITDRYPNADPTALLARRGASARACGAPRRGLRGPAALAPDRVLPAAARDPASRLARALVDRRVLRCDRAVVRDAVPRHAGRAAAPVPVAVGAVRAARLRVPAAHRESVPGLHRRDGALPGRSRAARAGPAEPLEDLLPVPARDPGLPRHRRARGGAVRGRVPHLVRRPRDGVGACRAAQPLGVRAALRVADERVPVSADGRVPAREPARGRGRAAALARAHAGRAAEPSPPGDAAAASRASRCWWRSRRSGRWRRICSGSRACRRR